MRKWLWTSIWRDGDGENEAPQMNNNKGAMAGNGVGSAAQCSTCRCKVYLSIKSTKERYQSWFKMPWCCGYASAKRSEQDWNFLAGKELLECRRVSRRSRWSRQIKNGRPTHGPRPFWCIMDTYPCSRRLFNPRRSKAKRNQTYHHGGCRPWSPGLSPLMKTVGSRFVITWRMLRPVMGMVEVSGKSIS